MRRVQSQEPDGWKDCGSQDATGECLYTSQDIIGPLLDMILHSIGYSQEHSGGTLLTPESLCASTSVYICNNECQFVEGMCGISLPPQIFDMVDAKARQDCIKEIDLLKVCSLPLLGSQEKNKMTPQLV